nr:reverse transcriptase domain-containing protein [Tanacetum cinerariifolium]
MSLKVKLTRGVQEAGDSRKGLDLDRPVTRPEVLNQGAAIQSHQGKKIRKKDSERRTVFKRLEKGVFHRLGDKEKSMSVYSNDSKRRSYHNTRRDTESCYQSSHSRETEFASEKRHNKRASSRRMEPLSGSADSAGGHWNSKPKRQKSRIEDDLSQPWEKCIKDPVEIHNIKQRDGESTKVFLRRKAVTFNQRTEATQWEDQKKAAKKGETSGKDKPLEILMVQPWQRIAKQRITQTFSPESVISFPSLGEEDGTEGPLIIKVEMGGHFVHHMFVDGGSSSKILYERCFNRFRLEVRSQVVPTATPLVGFSEELICPLGQLSMLVKIGDEEHSTFTWMNFIVIRSPSPYKVIIRRPGDYSARMHNGLKTRSTAARNRSSRIRKDSGSNSPSNPEQTIAIGSTLTEEGRKELCGLLRRNLDIFAWKPTDMTRVLRHIAEHRLNIREGCLPVRQKKKGAST